MGEDVMVCEVCEGALIGLCIISMCMRTYGDIMVYNVLHYIVHV